MTDTENQANQEEQASAQFAMQRIYVKDLSFESPNSPTIFQNQWQPNVQMDLNTSNSQVGDNMYEVVLSLTLTTKIEESVAYIIEIQQAGVFMIEGIEGPQLAQTLNAYCPNLLFPYARETIDSTLSKGSFPALMLAPVNFDAIFADAVRRQQEEAAASASTEGAPN